MYRHGLRIIANAIVTTSIGFARKFTAQPLFLAQVFSSAAGALSMVMAASAMRPGQFTTFSLLMLATQLCTGATRSFLFQPALVETRNNSNAHIHLRVALLGAMCAGIGFLIVATVLGVHKPLWLATLSIANVLPVMTEWLRLRGMALNKRWHVARGDAIRLVTTLPGILVLWWTTGAEVFFLFVSMTYLTTVVYLASRLPRVSAHLSPRHFWRPASSQLVDFMLAQLVSTIPLLVFAGFGTSVYIGGIRMAQSLLGPINLVIWASAMNFMADGATQDSHSKPSDLIRRGRRLGWILAAFCFLTVTLAFLTLVLSKFSFRGADNHSMTVGVLLVGAYLFTAAWTYPDTIVMRLLGHHSAATWGRVGVIAGTGAGYAVGYVMGGVDLSLIVAFVASAVANPLAFTVPAATIYRRYR
jgi:hypothetical protein